MGKRLSLGNVCASHVIYLNKNTHCFSWDTRLPCFSLQIKKSIFDQYEGHAHQCTYANIPKCIQVYAYVYFCSFVRKGSVFFTFWPPGPRAPWKPVEPLSPISPLRPCKYERKITNEISLISLSFISNGNEIKGGTNWALLLGLFC